MPAVIDVPAHIQYAERTQNNAYVKGGTNWDITRGTIDTPIQEVVPPEPVKKSPYTMGPRPSAILDRTPYAIQHEMPIGIDPSRTVYFDKNKDELTADAKSLLKSIPKGAEVILAGHADSRETNTPTIAEKRLNEVEAVLKDHGVKVELRKNFGATLQLSEEGKYSEVNRRVEVFIR